MFTKQICTVAKLAAGALAGFKGTAIEFVLCNVEDYRMVILIIIDIQSLDLGKSHETESCFVHMNYLLFSER